VIGLRGAAFLAPLWALLGAWALFRSPVRQIGRVDGGPGDAGAELGGQTRTA
jgi:hypothetical protein